MYVYICKKVVFIQSSYRCWFQVACVLHVRTVSPATTVSSRPPDGMCRPRNTGSTCIHSAILLVPHLYSIQSAILLVPPHLDSARLSTDNFLQLSILKNRKHISCLLNRSSSVSRNHQGFRGSLHTCQPPRHSYGISVILASLKTSVPETNISII